MHNSGLSSFQPNTEWFWSPYHLPCLLFLGQEGEIRLAALQWTPQCLNSSTCTHKQTAILSRWQMYRLSTHSAKMICSSFFLTSHVAEYTGCFWRLSCNTFFPWLTVPCWDAASSFHRRLDKKTKVRGRGVWAVWCRLLNTALNFTLSQFLTTSTGQRVDERSAGMKDQ